MVGVERVKEKNITDVIFFYEDPSLLELSKGNDSNRCEASKARNLLQVAPSFTTHNLATPRQKTRHKGGFFNWWELRGSNSRPSRCKRDALPAELNSHLAYGKYLYTHKKN